MPDLFGHLMKKEIVGPDRRFSFRGEIKAFFHPDINQNHLRGEINVLIHPELFRNIFVRVYSRGLGCIDGHKNGPKRGLRCYPVQ